MFEIMCAIRSHGDHTMYFQVDLEGGYHDAGDNVKFGLPLAFSVTTMAWGVVENMNFFEKADELGHAQDAVRWGTDYLLKTYPRPNELWAQVQPSIRSITLPPSLPRIHSTSSNAQPPHD